jgi:hypothetical protein
MLVAVAASLSGEPSARSGARAGASFAATSASASSSGDCSFTRNPSRFRDALRRHMEELSARTERAVALRSASPVPAGTVVAAAATSASSAAAPAAVATSEFAASDVPARNYVDDWIFDKMAQDGVPHAPLAADGEFFRRIHLDLTGRIPTSAETRAFLTNDDPSKRAALISTLLDSSEFVDRWTMYYGDLLRNTQADTNVRRFAEGRNAFYGAIKAFLSDRTPYDLFVKKLLTSTGSSYTVGEVNYPVGAFTPMGPSQDTADSLLVRSATQFLGLSNFDCLLCHNGAGHLDSINLWGSRTLRSDAWKMSAFFARTRMARKNLGSTNGVKYSWEVSDTNTGDYALNTSSGNRTARTALPDGSTTVKPSYLFAPTQAGGATYREAFASHLTHDRQFARAAVNYLWRELMGQGIVEPADQFDPARQDPANPPPDGWTIQPSHPELLEALADDFISHGYDVRHILGVIANSSAYQLSSTFDGDWRVEYEPYFARKYVRRLWAEEVHDAIVKATGVAGSYTPEGYTGAIQWAMQLPDTFEPRGSRAVAGFLDVFLRGNRDTNPRSGDASILQALYIMNNTFVTSRIKSTDARTTVARLLADKTLSDSALVDELFLTALSRFPTASEKTTALDGLKSAGRTAGTENLQWVLINKIDFLYNY